MVVPPPTGRRKRRLFRSRQARQVEALAPLEQLLRSLRLLTQTPKANKPLGGVVVELIAALVRRQFLAVQAVLALAADDRRLALEELDANQPAHETLVAHHELEQVLVKTTEPQSIIYYVCILLR